MESLRRLEGSGCAPWEKCAVVSIKPDGSDHFLAPTPTPLRCWSGSVDEVTLKKKLGPTAGWGKQRLPGHVSRQKEAEHAGGFRPNSGSEK